MPQEMGQNMVKTSHKKLKLFFYLLTSLTTGVMKHVSPFWKIPLHVSRLKRPSFKRLLAIQINTKKIKKVWPPHALVSPPTHWVAMPHVWHLVPRALASESQKQPMFLWASCFLFDSRLGMSWHPYAMRLAATSAVVGSKVSSLGDCLHPGAHQTVIMLF